MPRALATTLAVAALLAAGPTAAQGRRHVIDPDRSTIRFTVPYVFMIVGEVEGEFGSFTGWADYDPDDLEATRVEVEIDAASLDTRFAPRDVSLRGETFFAVDENPTIRFAGTGVRNSAEGYFLVGTLSLRGIEREALIPFELLDFGDSLVVLGSAKIDREAYGMSVPEATEDFRIGQTVTVRLHLTLKRSVAR